jgi:hypothetical protein
MKMKRTLLVLMCLTVLLLPLSLVAEGAAHHFSDLRNHWGESNITNWWRLGLVGGYADGTFRPDNTVNRAEFISFLNRAFGYVEEAEISFTDIGSGDWFYGEVARAFNMGYMGLLTEGNFRPYAPVSRLEAAEMLYNALQLNLHDFESPSMDLYEDIATLTPHQVGVVEAMVAKQLMVGAQNRFSPSRTITRAETIAILDRAAGEIHNAAGSFGSAAEQQVVSGNVTVSVAGVSLQNMLIEGDLYLTEGIGAGMVSLHNVIVQGTTILGAPAASLQQSGTTSFAKTVPPAQVTPGLTLVVEPSIGGAVIDVSDAAPYGLGSTVELLAEPATGYDFAGWSATSGTFDNELDLGTSFTMTEPGAVVTASFVFSYQASISVSHSESGAIAGGAWVPQEDLHASVVRQGDLLFEATVQPDGEGEFTIDPRSHAGFSIEDGDVVTVTQGDLVVVHVVKHLAVTVFSAEANTIGGQASAGDVVRVVIFDEEATTYDDMPMLQVTADADGNWEADFSGLFDLQVGTHGSAQIFDVHQNSTTRYWHVPATSFAVFPFENLIIGFDWAYGEELLLSRDGVSLGSMMIDDPWGYFEMAEIEISSGDVVVATDGITIRTLHVTPLELISIDRSSGVVSGLADPELPVTVQLIMPSQGYGPPQYADTRVITADVDGSWTVEYGHSISADYTIQVEQTDMMGNSTIVRDMP